MAVTSCRRNMVTEEEGEAKSQEAADREEARAIENNKKYDKGRVEEKRSGKANEPEEEGVRSGEVKDDSDETDVEG